MKNKLDMTIIKDPTTIFETISSRIMQTKYETRQNFGDKIAVVPEGFLCLSSCNGYIPLMVFNKDSCSKNKNEMPKKQLNFSKLKKGNEEILHTPTEICKAKPMSDLLITIKCYYATPSANQTYTNLAGKIAKRVKLDFYYPHSRHIFYNKIKEKGEIGVLGKTYRFL